MTTLTLELHSEAVDAIATQPVALTPLEAAAWRILVAAEGALVSRATLRLALFGEPHIGEPKQTVFRDAALVHAVLTGLRERCLAAGVYVETVPGEGVRVRRPAEGEAIQIPPMRVRVGDLPAVVTVDASAVRS